MVAFNFFEKFSEDFANGVHDFDDNSGAGYKIMLATAASVSATDAVKTDITETAGAGNGYTAGGVSVTMSTSRSGDTTKVIGAELSSPTWTASGGTIGPFQMAVLYNDRSTSPADPLIGWWDYGSSVTLQIGETFTVDLDTSNGIFNINPS
jgi:hypothetical protein